MSSQKEREEAALNWEPLKDKMVPITFYISKEHMRKIKFLSVRLNCTAASLVRSGIDVIIDRYLPKENQ